MAKGSSKLSKGGGGGTSSVLDKARNEAFNNLESKGNTVSDYYVTPKNHAIIALVKSKSGNFSLRQAFLLGSGDKYQGFKTFRLLNRMDESLAKMEFEFVVSEIQNRSK